MIANEEQSFWTRWKVTSMDGTPSKPFENQNGTHNEEKRS